MSAHDELFFATEESANESSDLQVIPWKIAVIDDDESVRAITRLAIGALKVDGRPLDLLEAASAEEGIALFATHPDIALGLVDMVMEDPTAGLRLITAVREHQGNHRTRLVVRTGQPGHLPEDRIIRDYDINDYREKTELSAQKLRTIVYSAIRSFRDIHLAEEDFHGMIELLSRVVDESIAEYFPHALSSAQMAGVLGRLAGLPATRTETLRRAAVLCDLGLFRLPVGVRNALLQYETLDDMARQAVLDHPLVGARLLERLLTIEGRLATELAREHHEHWDGGGYPRGLRGEEIGIGSRILAIVNQVDARFSSLSLHSSDAIESLRGNLTRQAGHELDPQLVQLALANLDTLLQARAKVRDAMP